MVASSTQTYDSLQATIKQWWDYNVQLSNEETIHSKQTYFEAKLVLGLLSGLALAFGGTAAFLITRSITAPLNRAVQIANTVAQGDLTQHIQVEGKDETSELLQSLKTMNDNLHGLVVRVRSSSSSIATGSTQIAIGSSDLSQRTEEQASNLQETAASMEEISGTIRSNSETAQQARDLATEASSQAESGGSIVASVVTTMQNITAASKKINDIIGVIDGIAFQTNILALNAAVEAARAGEQGRGFAVVAGEVRSLAGRCANAAKEIKVLINQSVESVEMGANQVDEAGAAMSEIVNQVRSVAQLISEIAVATSEQSSGINQVSVAVSQLDRFTQQNAALVEQSSAAAESLKQQACVLNEAMETFKC